MQCGTRWGWLSPPGSSSTRRPVTVTVEDDRLQTTGLVRAGDDRLQTTGWVLRGRNAEVLGTLLRCLSYSPSIEAMVLARRKPKLDLRVSGKAETRPAERQFLAW